MIHELRTYTFHPGALPAYLKLVEEVGSKVRGDDYGKRIGSFVADTGWLNQVWHIWEYESLDERARLRAALAQNKAWMNEFVAEIVPLLQRQEIRFMNPVLPLKPPTTSGNIYEFRVYRARMGRLREWVANITDIMPEREKHSNNVCLWTVESPEPNGVVHLWDYPGWDARAAARGAAMQDPAWQGFLGKAGPLLEEMYSTIAYPAPFSPMQ